MATNRPSRRARMYVLEFLITTGILFLIVTAARWIFAPDAPLGSEIDGRAAFAVMAVIFGIANTVIIHYSMTRRTAGHMNPSVSIGLWLLRAFPGRDVLPFCLAQLAGAFAGTALGRLVWGPAVESVDYSAVGAAPGWDVWDVLTAETVGQLICMTLVAGLLIRPRWEFLIPSVVGTCIAGFIFVLGPVAGGSVNPVRQLGPAVLSGNTAFLAAYLIGPVLGAALAAALAAGLRPPAPPAPEFVPPHAPAERVR
ncbi:aquaporin [Streptomyces sp. HUAS MG47]|uniref:aquaporin n=1 Tax=Streptomyces solicamelliae TaxID=3231716 RepID=UPI003877B1AE